MSIYAPPSSVPPSHRPVISDLIRHADGGSSFTISFTANQELPTHRNNSKVLISVLNGSGDIFVGDDAGVGVVAGKIVQIPANQPHSVTAGPNGMLIEVHLINESDACSCC